MSANYNIRKIIARPHATLVISLRSGVKNSTIQSFTPEMVYNSSKSLACSWVKPL